LVFITGRLDTSWSISILILLSLTFTCSNRRLTLSFLVMNYMSLS